MFSVGFPCSVALVPWVPYGPPRFHVVMGYCYDATAFFEEGGIAKRMWYRHREYLLYQKVISIFNTPFSEKLRESPPGRPFRRCRPLPLTSHASEKSPARYGGLNPPSRVHRAGRGWGESPQA